MAPTYKVEELLAVRGSVSESAVSLEKFADEDAVKEHVLRPSASASRIGARSENTAPPSAPRSPSKTNHLRSTPRFTAPANESLKRVSPTSSIKKAKAERLLKEHGSPPGRRVTAGGRIVPTDWTWSGNYAPPYPNGRFIPFYPYQRQLYPFFASLQQPSGFPNGFVGYDLTGKLCQIVDGEMRELKNGHLFMAAPNMPFSVVNTLPGNSTMTGVARLFSQPTTTVMSGSGLGDDAFLGLDKMPFEKQMQYLDGEMKKAKLDHNQIERKEVLQEHALSDLERETMVNMKRDLINKMDQIRKFKKGLEEFHSGMAMSASAAYDFAAGAVDPRPRMSMPGGFPPQISPPTANLGGPFYASSSSSFQMSGSTIPTCTTGWTEMSNPEPMQSMPPYEQDTLPFVPSFSIPQPGKGVDEGVRAGISTSPESACRLRNKRSHAIEIKAPPKETQKTRTKSGLDPTSPMYEPAHIFVPPTPSPIDSPAPHPATQHTWLNNSNNTDASESSVSTSNFFPNDAAEHSQRKHTFARPSNAQSGAEVSAFSGQIHNTTPQKDWIRNSQMASKNASPERDRTGKTALVAPMDTRMSSWTQDILPSLEPVSTRHSPELSRINGMNSIEPLNNTPARVSAHGTPLRRSGVLDGKSDDWCQGYMFGSTGASGTQPDAGTTLEYKAGFYQGLADCEKKRSLSGQTVPYRDVSRHPSAHSLRMNSAHVHSFGNTFMNDSAINLPHMVENMRGSLGHSHQHGDVWHTSFSMVGNPAQNNEFTPYSTAAHSSHGLSSLSTTANTVASKPQATPSPTKRTQFQRGYSESAADAMHIQTMTATDGDASPFLWKDKHLREQQVASIRRPLEPTARSGNQPAAGNRVTSNTFNNQRYYPALKTMQTRAEPRVLDPIGTKRRPENVSHFDGASDDLAGLDPHGFTQTQNNAPVDSPRTTSPSKAAVTPAESHTQSNGASPKKVNSSPSKTKEVRDRVTSTARRMLKGSDQPSARLDPGEMDLSQRERHRSQWRKRFQKIKKEDREEVQKNRVEREKP